MYDRNVWETRVVFISTDKTYRTRNDLAKQVLKLCFNLIIRQDTSVSCVYLPNRKKKKL